MKKILFTVSVLAASLEMTSAQNTEGKIIYEEKRRLHLVVDSSQAAMMASLPKEMTSKSILLFTPEVSYYQNEKEEEKDNTVNGEEEGRRVMIKMEKPDNRFYRDLKNGKLTQQREFMSRKFLVTGNDDGLNWKMTGNQKKILDYSCMEAVRQDGDKKITAWFTSAIPVSSGPAQYGGLPGMIMEVNVNDDELSLTAVDLSFASIDKRLIVKPTEGKKVTEAEFRQIVDEKTKEMQEQNGGNGNVIIRMHNDGPR